MVQPTSPKWLEDILRACSYIREDVAGHSLETYLVDRRARQLVERNLNVIGEIIIRIERADPGLAENISSRRKITGMRNRLAHGYDDDIDHKIIWAAIHEALPELERDVATLMPDFPD
jgi:uncharacterized protein with HEPN domain